jgi:hypothetical protein
VIGLAEHNFKHDPRYAKMHQQTAASSAIPQKSLSLSFSFFLFLSLSSFN